MKIAVVLFEERVSPRFGGSSEVLVVETAGSEILREETQDVGRKRPMELARRLVNMRVDKLICGGINRYHKEWLKRKGVSVLDNRMGRARDMLEELIEGDKDKGTKT
ncbi:MAG: hypothetical protein JRJ29_22570 [Deltaproteobacteria bacterium]|nr:hypothetical protein [Deltaproteobacteria bacterium]